jgi:hypothetical protein
VFKIRRVLRGFAIGILLICTVYILYSIISNPLGKQDIMFPLAVAAGFIALGSNKSRKKDE